MSDRLNELANSASALRSTLTVCGQSKPQLDENLRDISALLRSASAETVGTEWDDDPVRFPYPTRARQRHNADLHAARLAIAGLKAELDHSTARSEQLVKDLEGWKRYVYQVREAAKADDGDPFSKVIERIAALLSERDAALASLAEKQRAIEECFRLNTDQTDSLAALSGAIYDILRPHATKATEAKPSATVTGSGLCCTDCDPVFRKAYGLDEVAPATTPNSVAREIASVESGDIRYRVWECRVIVPADAPLPDGFDAPPRRAVIDAITSRGIDILRCASGWGHTPTDDELGVLDKEIHYPSQPATPATTPTAAGATPAADDDTRDLIARLALAVRNDAAERCNAELEAACDAIIAAVRRGGVA